MKIVNFYQIPKAPRPDLVQDMLKLLSDGHKIISEVACEDCVNYILEKEVEDTHAQ